MTNSSRNTLVLIALFLVSAVISTIALRNSSMKLSVGKAKLKETKEQIMLLNRAVANREILEEEYDLQLAVAGSQFKIIFDDDSSIITYNYLLRILGWLNRDIYYDFGMSKRGDGGYNEYVINGVASYMDLVRFTRLIEYQRALLTIEDITVNRQIAHSDSIGFSMMFRTYSHADGLPASAITYNTMNKSINNYSLFRPRYTQDFHHDEDIDPRLLDLESSTLIAISEDHAFIRDATGIIRMLKRGDSVLYGYLQKIDSREGLALFRVNKYGFEENQILYLNN